MLVVGMGERKTPKSFISACNRFKYLDILANSESKTKSKLDMQFGQMEKSKNYMLPLESEHVKEDMTNIKTIEDAIRAIAEEYSDEDEWIFTGTIGNLLVKRYPDFDVRNFGYRKLTAFLEALDLFDIKKVRTGDGDAKLIYVKLKN